jgi:hypothetical protein
MDFKSQKKIKKLSLFISHGYFKCLFMKVKEPNNSSIGLKPIAR